MKYKWKVQPEPTGRYRSFETRGWPHAVTPDGHIIAGMYCEDSYSSFTVKTGRHKPILIYVPVKQEGGGYRNRRLKGEWDTLDEAKDAFARFVKTHPEHDFGIDVKPS